MKAGITGHQNLSAYNIQWIKEQLAHCIQRFNITHGISSLAIGADQLFIEILLQKNISYTVVIPCNDYEKTFTSENDLKKFIALKSKSKNVIQLPFSEPSEEAFYAAGKKVTELSDMMIAIWDGGKARGLGGTADIVHYSIELQKKTIHINPILKTVTGLSG